MRSNASPFVLCYPPGKMMSNHHEVLAPVALTALVVLARACTPKESVAERRSSRINLTGTG